MKYLTVLLALIFFASSSYAADTYSYPVPNGFSDASGNLELVRLAEIMTEGNKLLKAFAKPSVVKSFPNLPKETPTSLITIVEPSVPEASKTKLSDPANRKAFLEAIKSKIANDALIQTPLSPNELEGQFAQVLQELDKPNIQFNGSLGIIPGSDFYFTAFNYKIIRKTFPDGRVQERAIISPVTYLVINNTPLMINFLRSHKIGSEDFSQVEQWMNSYLPAFMKANGSG
ncbi:MAG: hypothetical protein AAF571_06615 [Verrucomicrobiota bacterium]